MADQFIGRRVNLGIARETTRGTFKVPDFWLPRTTLSFDDKVNKHTEEESLGVIDDADAKFNTEKWGEGDVEGEIRGDSFGLLLYAMLGTCSSAVKETTAYNHDFTLAQTNNHQSLSFLINDPISDDAGEGDRAFPLVMLDSLTISVEVGQVATYTATWISKPSDKFTAQTASYSVENKFVANHLGFKLADARADLAAASTIPIKTLEITFSKNLLRNMVLGSIEPEDIYNQQFAVEGSFTLDHTDRTYRNLMLDNTYQAMQIEMINDGVTIGASSNPELDIVLPRCNFHDWETDRTLNDISVQTVNFKGLRDVANSEDIVYNILLVNETTSY